MARLACLVVALLFVNAAWAQLASWNDGDARRSILAFVAAVTDKKSKDYVAPAERIAELLRS